MTKYQLELNELLQTKKETKRQYWLMEKINQLKAKTKEDLTDDDEWNKNGK